MRSLVGFAFFLLSPLSLFGQGIITTAVGTEWIFNSGGKPALNTPLGSIAFLSFDPAGNLVFADPSNSVVLRLNSDATVTVLAGNGLMRYSGDGGGATNAALRSPQGTAFDQRGNLYIADFGNHRVRRVAPDGTISTFAGNGVAAYSGDGSSATSASLNLPLGVAVDASGNVYVNDRGNSRIRRVTPNGIISTVAGSGTAGFSGDGGPATAASLGAIEGMALDGSGNLYLADFGNNRIRKVDSRGIISTVAGDGRDAFAGDGGPAVSASLSAPGGVAVGGNGAIYIADTSNFRIRRIGADGIIRTVAGTGTQGLTGDGGPALNATFRSPFGVVVDATDTLYVADRDNYRIRKIVSSGNISTIAGNGGFRVFADGILAGNAFLFQPFGVSFDTGGNLFIADTSSNRIRRVSPNGSISTIAGNGGREFTGDGGPAVLAGLASPFAVVVDRSNNLYIADTDNHRIRRVGPDGTITTVAGNGTAGFSGDGGNATQAALNSPQQVALDSAGNLYISDTGNSRVRRVGLNGAITTVVTGLSQPSGLAIDTAGALYVADAGNSRILRVVPSGVISTVLNLADSGGRPRGLLLDSAGTLFFSDTRTNRVMRLASNGALSVVAGNGVADFRGDGGLSTNASLNIPYGLAMNSAGDLFIADISNDRIRVVRSSPVNFQPMPDTLSFNVQSGGDLSDSQGVALNAPIAGLTLNVAATTSDGGQWLRLNSTSVAAPQPVQVSVDPFALMPGSYQGTVTITSATGVSRIVRVQVAVSAAAAANLKLGRESLTFAAVQGAPPAVQELGVLNSGGGTLSFTANLATTGRTWLSLVTASGQSTPSRPGSLSVQADPSGLAPGTYTETITIRAAGKQIDIPVTLTVSQGRQKLLLSQTGLRFTAVLGAGAPLAQSVAVLNAGQGSLNWTAEVCALSSSPSTPNRCGTDAGWLAISTASGVSVAGSRDIRQIQVSIIPAGLNREGEYYGQVTVRPATEGDSPAQSVIVILNVLPAGSSPGPEVRPNGFVFTGDPDSSPGSEEITISNAGSQVLTYSSSRTTEDGRNWFLQAPTNGTLTPNQPVRGVVQPDFTGLSDGIRRGSITFSFSDGSVRTVSVVSVVSAGAAAGTVKEGLRYAGCSRSGLTVQFVSPGDGATVPVAQPVPLQVKVVDNCQTPIGAEGRLKVQFSNGDDDLSMVHSGGGLWTGNWQPNRPATAPVKLVVDAFVSVGNAVISGRDRLTLTLRANTTTPRVTPGAVLNAASFAGNVPIAPGSLITVFGDRLADAGGVSNNVPLATELGGTQVMLGDRLLPLLYASDKQVNAQVPYNLIVNTQHQLMIRRNDTISVPETLTVAPAEPAVFTVNQQGTGQALVFVARADGSQTLADTSNPAKAGDVVVIYCAGLGPVSPAVESGAAAPLSPLSRTVNAVTVLIGDKEAAVSFAGLTPGNAGLYQVNATAPAGVTGNSVLVVLKVAGRTSPSVTMAVR